MSDYLKQVEDQLVELTERGAHRRPRPRLDLLALAGAVVIVAVVAVVVSTIGGNARRVSASHRETPAPRHATYSHHGRQRTSTVTVSPSTLPSGPVPAGFGPESFSAIGEFAWWMLGSAPCSSPPCTSIVRTTDGGRSFVGTPAPRTQNVSQLRFADSLDGFAYDPQLWVTHDGGKVWRQVRVQGQVTDLAAGLRYVYAIVRGSGGSGSLFRSALGYGTDVWKAVPIPGNAVSGLWVHGDDVLLEGANSSGQYLLFSTDDGAHFRTESVPPNVACQLEAPAPPVIWAHCATGTLSGTWRSTNGGRTFPAAGRGLPEMPNSAAFGSASATTAVVGYRQLYRTTDGGNSWAPVAGATGITWWQYLGFTDPTHGVALGYVGSARPSNERLYYTTDGGASYHLVRVH